MKIKHYQVNFEKVDYVSYSSDFSKYYIEIYFSSGKELVISFDNKQEKEYRAYREIIERYI